MARSRSAQPAGKTVRRWNRFAFRLWGPANIGDLSAPIPKADPDPPCPHCGSLESVHQNFRTADGKFLRRCPS